MRIAQLSDFHFTSLPWNPLRLFSKRFLGIANWLFTRKNYFLEDQVAPLPPLFQELKVDLVLLGGDFSSTALFEEFEKGTKFLDKLQQPWIAVPGNHDHYTWRSYRQKHFYRYFANRGEKRGDWTLAKDQIELHPLSNEWWVIALDTTLATPLYSSQGLFSEALEQKLVQALYSLPKTASILLLTHYPFFQNDSARHSLKRGEELEALIQKHPQIRLYLHGHTHRHTIADLQASNLPLILDSGSCAQKERGSWNLIDLTLQGCTVTPYRWQGQWNPSPSQEFVWKNPGL